MISIDPEKPGTKTLLVTSPFRGHGHMLHSPAERVEPGRDDQRRDGRGQRAFDRQHPGGQQDQAVATAMQTGRAVVLGFVTALTTG